MEMREPLIARAGTGSGARRGGSDRAVAARLRQSEKEEEGSALNATLGTGKAAR